MHSRFHLLSKRHTHNNKMHSSIFVLTGFLCLFSQCKGQEPVKVTTYYESLCPYSRDFIVDQFYPTYNSLKEIMVYELFAYGKATDVSSGDGGYDFVCQHGPDECYGNLVLGCGRKYIADQDIYADFVNCIMSTFDPVNNAQLCTESVGMNWTTIATCSSSSEGEIFLHDLGVQQSQLAHPLTYVPYIVINDEWTLINKYLARYDLKRAVCNTYTGTKPQACFT